MTKHYFPNVTLLITHYNRPNSLERLLSTFAGQNCSFGEIIVSDDGSRPDQRILLDTLQTQYGFQLLTNMRNQGLGHNLNKGQRAVKTPYTLYVQEDFIPQLIFSQHFADALKFMEQDVQLDIVRFYAYFPYPYLQPFGNGFSKMIFPAWATNYNKIYYYSDHPHLRRSSFLEKFGPYVEGLPGDRTEYKMCLSFIQKKGKGLFFNSYKNLFSQENNSQEPSTMKRSDWKRSSNIAIALVRDLYRQLKYNYDLNFR